METHFTDTRSKLLGHLDRIQAIKEDRVEPPINVEIDLSNRCSLGCDWCHFAHTHTKGPLHERRLVEVGDLMDSRLAQRIIFELKDYGVRSVTWTGGGEPTLHPQHSEIFSVCHEARLPQGLYTNGCHIDAKLARLLAKTMEWVYVSLDEVDRESYRKQKKADRFIDACRGARYLSEAGATLGVGFLLHSGNYRRTEDMVALTAALNATYCQFRPTVMFDASNPSCRIGDAAYAKAVANGPPTFYWSDVSVEMDCSRFAQYAYWKGHGYDSCIWSGVQTVITPDGKVWTCCNKRGESGAEIGDLNQDSFAKIWSRRKIASVNDRCRVMCRGHLGNQVLHQIMSPRDHEAFV